MGWLILHSQEKIILNDIIVMINVIISYKIGNSVTVMSPEGIPIQVNAAALQTAALQNTPGMIGIDYSQRIFIMIINKV